MMNTVSLRLHGMMRSSISRSSMAATRAFTQAPIRRQTPKLQPPTDLDEAEKSIFEKLRNELAPVSALEVRDVSGGCGQMYNVNITSEQFKGLTMIKQHRMVNRVLKEEVKTWHGLQLKTTAP